MMAWSLTESHGGVVQYETASRDVHYVNLDWDEIEIPDNPEYVTEAIRQIKPLPKEHRQRILTEIRKYWKIDAYGDVEWVG